jgi:hypothetical protein
VGSIGGTKRYKIQNNKDEELNNRLWIVAKTTKSGEILRKHAYLTLDVEFILVLE